MSPFSFSTPAHSFVVLHSTIERVSRTLDTHAMTISPVEPLAITQTFDEANKVLEYYKKKITSRKDTNAFSLCFWYETIDGVDIARVPRGRNVVEEVRLRVVGVNVWGEGEGGDGEDRRIRALQSHAEGEGDGSAGKGCGEVQGSKDSDGRGGESDSRKPSQGQEDGIGESKDRQDAADDEYVETDQPQLRTPHPEGIPYDFEKTRLRLRNAPPGWPGSGTESTSNQTSDQQNHHVYADVDLDSHHIPNLPRASSIDGRIWTTKYGHISDGAYLRWVAGIMDASI